MPIAIKPRRPGGRLHVTIPASALDLVDGLAAKHGVSRTDVARSLLEAAIEQVRAESGGQ
jgi:hypothetical protein